MKKKVLAKITKAELEKIERCNDLVKGATEVLTVAKQQERSIWNMLTKRYKIKEPNLRLNHKTREITSMDCEDDEG